MTDLELYRRLFDLSNCTAVVIGAGSGIGEAGAEALAAQGARVVCADLSTASAEHVATGINEGGGEASVGTVDVGDRDSVEALYEDVGEIDVLVTTPAINVRKRMLDTTEEEARTVVDLNLIGTFNAITGAGRRMADAGGGSIIAISSIRSQVVEPGQGVYAATKAGVLQMIRTLASELGPHGVRANALAPGVVETPLTAQIKNQPDWYNAYAEKGALGRWASPIEMSGPIVFLASEASSFVTGSLLVADGGWLAVDGRFMPPL
ncbi:MAG TPA: SDR family oxidoreductase [Acidimicrobiia bacterium]|nr:SDR family oxidoreductase [Acidimicrobiia bacterium]